MLGLGALFLPQRPESESQESERHVFQGGILTSVHTSLHLRLGQLGRQGDQELSLSPSFLVSC